MIIDITGIPLTPGNLGKDCLGNGTHMDEKGNEIPCCCDGCDYMQCCLTEHAITICENCTDTECSRMIQSKTHAGDS